MNADDSSMLTEDQGNMQQYNLFAYCFNNPVNNLDPDGYSVVSIRIHLALANYFYNKLHDITSGYINGQALGAVSKMRFGLCPMSFNGCEIIATYNALKLKGKKASLANIALEFELNGSQMAYGALGSNPYLIGRYLTVHGVKYSTALSLKGMNNLVRKYGTYIISFLYKENFYYKIHTVAAYCNANGTFSVYNYFDNDTSSRPFNSISDIIDGGRLIIGYYLK